MLCNVCIYIYKKYELMSFGDDFLKLKPTAYSLPLAFKHFLRHQHIRFQTNSTPMADSRSLGTSPSKGSFTDPRQFPVRSNCRHCHHWTSLDHLYLFFVCMSYSAKLSRSELDVGNVISASIGSFDTVAFF